MPKDIARDLDPALTIVGPTPIGGITAAAASASAPRAAARSPCASTPAAPVTCGRPAPPRIAARGSRSSPTTRATCRVLEWRRARRQGPRGHPIRPSFESGIARRRPTVRRHDQFWDVATVQSSLLRPPVTLVQTDPAFDHSSTATFAVGAAYRPVRSHHRARADSPVQSRGDRTSSSRVATSIRHSPVRERRSTSPARRDTGRRPQPTRLRRRPAVAPTRTSDYSTRFMMWKP